MKIRRWQPIGKDEVRESNTGQFIDVGVGRELQARIEELERERDELRENLSNILHRKWSQIEIDIAEAEGHRLWKKIHGIEIGGLDELKDRAKQADRLKGALESVCRQLKGVRPDHMPNTNVLSARDIAQKALRGEVE